MNRLTRLAAAGAASALAALVAAAVLSGASAAAQPPLTFNGQCQLSGSVSFSPLLTTSPGLVRNDAMASGTCSGTLTDRSGRTMSLNNAPVSYSATEVGSQESCELNLNAPGSGALTFSAGKLGFQILENRLGGTALLSLTGSQGGSASAVAMVNSPDPAGVLQQCSDGGVSSVPVDLTLQTTPAISG